jgi:hypothetical protein
MPKKKPLTASEIWALATEQGYDKQLSHYGEGIQKSNSCWYSALGSAEYARLN